MDTAADEVHYMQRLRGIYSGPFTLMARCTLRVCTPGRTVRHMFQQLNAQKFIATAVTQAYGHAGMCSVPVHPIMVLLIWSCLHKIPTSLRADTWTS